MEDIGFSGTGSRFGTRFEAGSPILASQLNALATGIQAGLPMPYLGDGASVSFTAGGAVIAPGAGAISFVTRKHPFFVEYIGKVDGDPTIQVTPGTYNNLDPLCFGPGYMTDIPPPTAILSAAEYSYVYISAGPSGSTPPDFPDPSASSAGYPTVSVQTSEQVDTDAIGWVLLATIHRTVDVDGNDFYTVSQYVTGSLWGEYFKCGDDPALYWNTRV